MKFMHRNRVLSIAFLLSMAPCHATLQAAALQDHTSSHNKTNANVHLQILAINDFHGQITTGVKVSGRPVGSAPVLAAYLEAAASGKENSTFIVHAGDFVGASPPESALLQDEPSISFFNMMGNHFCTTKNFMHPKCNLVGTVGNHEFDEGREEMLRLFHGGTYINGPFIEDPWLGAAFPHVCANVIDDATRKPFLPRYVIKKIQNVPVAFIGAVLQDTASIVTASGIQGLSFTDEVQAINKQVHRLKRQGVHTIIVLLHQGGTQTAYTGTTDSEAGEVSGEIVEIVKALDSEVDVVVSAHTHGFTNALITNNEGKEILVTQAWSKGSAYADINLDINKRSRDVVTRSAEIVTTWADEGPGLVPDLRVAALVDEAKSVTEPMTGQVIGYAGIAISKEQNSAGELALGNLIADAQRTAMGTDFAFMNPGGIRADLDAGDVTWGELYTIQPFNNYLVSMELTGQQIYDLLNQQFTPYQPYNRILQISGLNYTWDANRPAGDLVVEVRKDGSLIDFSATYTVTVNSFMAEGGDKFTVLIDGVNKQVGPVDLDALVDYVDQFGTSLTNVIEGRIVRQN